MSEQDYRRYLEKVEAAKRRLDAQIDMFAAVGRSDLTSNARALVAEPIPAWQKPGLFSGDKISPQLLNMSQRLHGESKALMEAFDRLQRAEIATARDRAEAAIRAGEEHIAEGQRLVGALGAAVITCPSCGTRHSGRRILESRGCPNCSSDVIFMEPDAATPDPAVGAALRAAGAWVQNAAVQVAAAKGRELLVMAVGQEQAVHERGLNTDAVRTETKERLRESEERQQIARDLRDLKQRLK